MDIRRAQIDDRGLATSHNKTAIIVGIDDINDPPNWVKHASKHHGDGVLVTSDEGTKELYEKDNFPVEFVDLDNRENLEG